MHYIYILGCPNTPGKGVRYCHSHEGLARKYIDENIAVEDAGKIGISTDEDLIIVRVLNNKLTRQTINWLDKETFVRWFSIWLYNFVSTFCITLNM